MQYLLCLILILFHGKTPPAFNDPAIHGACYTPQYIADQGAERLHFPPTDYYDELGEWVPYATVNGVGPATEPCSGWYQANGSYVAAGRIGYGTKLSLWTRPKVGLPPGTIGAYVWSTDYVSVRYTTFGWSALKPPVYVIPFTPDNSWQSITSNGLIGWNMLVQVPDDPGLIGQRLFYQGVMVNPIFPIEHPLSGTWMLTFHDND